MLCHHEDETVASESLECPKKREWVGPARDPGSGTLEGMKGVPRKAPVRASGRSSLQWRCTSEFWRIARPGEGSRAAEIFCLTQSM